MLFHPEGTRSPRETLQTRNWDAMKLLASRLSPISLLILALVVLLGAAQEPDDRKPQKPESTGVATGNPHPPVKDALSRPITAGGFVDGAPIVFIDVTKQAGLDRFRHRSGSPEKTTILETPGSGVALLDYDNDDWLDIYLLNGSTFAALRGKEPPPQAMLFHNNHDGTFTDVTEKAGVALGGWSTGPTWGDYDHDGLLDLFVPGYVKFDPNHPPVAGQAGISSNSCQFR